MVIYRPLYEKQEKQEIYIRKESMFLEKIPNRPDNITGQTIRFQLCEELTKNYIKK